MKKVNKKHHRYLIIIAEKRYFRRRESIKRKNIKNSGRLEKEKNTKTEEKDLIFTIKAPTIFELQSVKHQKKLVYFLDELKKRTLVDSKSVCIDFSKTRGMVVCGTLLFFAELDHILGKIDPNIKITCKLPKKSDIDGTDSNVVHQVLQHLGILKKLNYTKRSVSINHKDVKNWKDVYGTNADASEIGNILENESNLPKIKAKKLYRGVSEAMTNVPQHAYIDIGNTGNELQCKEGWWAFFREESDHISVAFCDLGVGIPITLPYTQGLSIVDKFIKILGFKGICKDADLIRTALEIKRSRTGLKHRGKGLLDMIKVIESNHDGRLTILSNRGGYSVIKENGKSKEDTKTFKHSITGTLILWVLPLHKE